MLGNPYSISIHNELNNIPRVIGQQSHSCAWNELTVLLEKTDSKMMTQFLCFSYQ